MTAAGIDDLNVYGSTLAVEAQALAEARGLARSDVTRLGLVRRALTPSFEDPITLAANAARPLVDAYGRDAFELLIVATESGIDYAKPLSSYVHKYLGLSDRCFHLETKHACFSATAALTLAASWVESNPDKRALVIATDMARRLFKLPAEIAEGAGAVAMAVTRSPRVLALEPHRGVAAREIYDIRRPTPVVEIGDTELSLAAYLDLLEQSWGGYAAAVGPEAFARLAYLVFHTPLVGLVQEGHRLLAELDGEPTADEMRTAMLRIQRGAEGNDPLLILRPGFRDRSEFFQRYYRLSGILMRRAPLQAGDPVILWDNPQARYPLPSRVRTALARSHAL